MHTVWQCGQTLFMFSPHPHTPKHLSGWFRPTLFLCLIHINTNPAESRRAPESLPGYTKGQSVPSYSTVQPLSTAAPYRVHKAWWMAYHHLPLWWLLNAVTPHQAHASEVRHIKKDRQAKAEHNDENKKRQCGQNDGKRRIRESDTGKEKKREKKDREMDEGASLMFARINAHSITGTEPSTVPTLLWWQCPTHVDAVFRACKIYCLFHSSLLSSSCHSKGSRRGHRERQRPDVARWHIDSSHVKVGEISTMWARREKEKANVCRGGSLRLKQ